MHVILSRGRNRHELSSAGSKAGVEKKLMLMLKLTIISTVCTQTEALLTVLVHRQHASTFTQQLLHHHRQPLPGCHVQRPAGSEGQQVSGEPWRRDRERRYIHWRSTGRRAEKRAWTHVWRAALVQLTRFLSLIFSRISRAHVS